MYCEWFYCRYDLFRQFPITKTKKKPTSLRTVKKLLQVLLYQQKAEPVEDFRQYFPGNIFKGIWNLQVGF